MLQEASSYKIVLGYQSFFFQWQLTRGQPEMWALVPSTQQKMYLSVRF